jgi:hypothetical protein
MNKLWSWSSSYSSPWEPEISAVCNVCWKTSFYYLYYKNGFQFPICARRNVCRNLCKKQISLNVAVEWLAHLLRIRVWTSISGLEAVDTYWDTCDFSVSIDNVRIVLQGHNRFLSHSYQCIVHSSSVIRCHTWSNIWSYEKNNKLRNRQEHISFACESGRRRWNKWMMGPNANIDYTIRETGMMKRWRYVMQFHTKKKTVLKHHAMKTYGTVGLKFHASWPRYYSRTTKNKTCCFRSYAHVT